MTVAIKTEFRLMRLLQDLNYRSFSVIQSVGEHRQINYNSRIFTIFYKDKTQDKYVHIILLLYKLNIIHSGVYKDSITSTQSARAATDMVLIWKLFVEAAMTGAKQVLLLFFVHLPCSSLFGAHFVVASFVPCRQ